MWGAALVAATLIALWPALDARFVGYDDDGYITENRAVQEGLTGRSLRWALTTGANSNWHPVTWFSHLLDVELWGLNPRGHHAASLAIHIVNSLLLLLLLVRLTGAVGRSAFVAALFALHPCHVESVAWVAERKDVLAALFWFLTTWAYVRWCERPKSGRYAAMLALYALGLMSKPMLVTLPFTLLLLDLWPLRRVDGSRLAAIHESPPSSAGDLVVPRTPWPVGRWRDILRGMARRVPEKLPLLALAALSSFVTFLVQRAGGAVQSVEAYPFGVRVANAIVAYATYLGRLLWPSGLAVFYPHPGRSLEAWTVAYSAATLAALTLLALRAVRTRPYATVGWLWFLGTLVPVIGLVQVGWQATADRYTYIPAIGVFLIVSWGGADLAERLGRARALVPALAALILAVLGLATFRQAQRWYDDESLFRHALAVTENNFVSANNLAFYLNEQGRPTEALPLLQDALRWKPIYSEAHVNLGKSYHLLGRYGDAEKEFRGALRLTPDEPVATNNVARSRWMQGDAAGAISSYQRAAERAPDWGELHEFLGIVLASRGRWSESLPQLERAAALEPGRPNLAQLASGVRAFAQGRSPDAGAREALAEALARTHTELSLGLQASGKKQEALAELREAMRWRPDNVELINGVGSLLLELGQPAAAKAEFERALRLDPRNAASHNNVGYMLFLEGHLPEAIAHYEEALRLNPTFELARNNLALARKRPVEAGAARAPRRERG